MPEVLLAKSNHKLFKFLAVFILILLILAGIYFYRRSSTNQPQTNQAPISKLTLDTCQVKKAGNPLVSGYTASDSKISGTFQGLVKTVRKDTSRNSYIITLTSLDKTQEYDFNIRQLPGMTSLSTVQTNQPLTISFECDPKSQGFKFTRVTVEATPKQ